MCSSDLNKNCGVCFLSFKSSLYILDTIHFILFCLTFVLPLSGLGLFFHSENLSLFSALETFIITFFLLYFLLLKNPRR